MLHPLSATPTYTLFVPLYIIPHFRLYLHHFYRMQTRGFYKVVMLHSVPEPAKHVFPCAEGSQNQTESFKRLRFPKDTIWFFRHKHILLAPSLHNAPLLS